MGGAFGLISFPDAKVCLDLDVGRTQSRDTRAEVV